MVWGLDNAVPWYVGCASCLGGQCGLARRCLSATFFSLIVSYEQATRRAVDIGRGNRGHTQPPLATDAETRMANIVAA